MPSTFLDSFEDIKFDIPGVRLPEIKIPKHYFDKLGVEQTISNAEFLRLIVREGLKKLGVYNNKAYTARAKVEFDTINEIGFTDYILLVWDVINFCHENEIPVGKGRGSAAGSLILYAIGVTGIDPIKNSLLFERFISKTRAKSKVIDGVRYIDGSLAPDVDLDICTDRRAEVIEYLKLKYNGNFCKLPTISTLATRAALKDVCKIFGGMREDEVNDITRLIPTKFGQPLSIDESYKDNEQFAAFCDDNPELIHCAKILEGMMRQKGSHASAFLISYRDLDEFLPCELDTHGELTSSFDMNYSQQESIKLDLLGLHGVTLIANIEKALGINSDNFDPDDPFIYDMGQLGNLPYGLFQIGADANYRVFKQVKPKSWEELSAVVALARPGALAYVDEYCENKYNEHFGNAALKAILDPTHNVPLYQEQAMRIAHEVFGFTLEEAETLRRIVGKKKVEEMKPWKAKVFEAAEKMGLQAALGDFYWNLLEASANYSFNLSHAAAYSYLSALTLYYKYKHPQIFYCECLKMAQNKSDSQAHVALIESELKFFGIKLLQPCLINSKEDFTVEGDDIRFGFSCIKGISEKSLPALKTFLHSEKSNKFEIFNAASESKLKIDIVCALIQAGMLNALGSNRERLVFEAQMWNKLTDREQAYCLAEGEKHGFNLIDMVKVDESKGLKGIYGWIGANGKKVVTSKTRYDTIKKNLEKAVEIWKQNKQWPQFASWFYEKKLLGYSHTTTLKAIFEDAAPTIQTAMEIENRQNDALVEGVFEVREVKKGTSARGNKYLKLLVGDETGSFWCMMVGEKYNTFLLKEQDPKEESIVLVVGKKDTDIVWVNSLKEQSNKIYMKFTDMR